ncbi:YlmC/YmxH family sporulation protein OS=Lysinibacillus sphaericus OX=1421 GN=LS41612_17550 PE=4 SV=1 [Lysinibacillus sphaericus]
MDLRLLKKKCHSKKKKVKVSEMIPWHEIILIGEDRILFNKTTTVQS